MGLGSVPIFILIALPVAVLALLLHAVGYGTKSWQKTELGGVLMGEEGLWEICTYTLGIEGCKEFAVTGTTKRDDELRTVRALGSIALIMLIVVCVTTFLSFCLEFLRNKCFGMLNMLTALAAGGIIFVAVIIYGSDLIPANSNAMASWSLALSVVGAILAIAAGILIGVGVFCASSSSSSDSK